MNTLIKLIKNKPIISSLILIIMLNEFTDIPLQNYLSTYIPYNYSLMLSIFILQMLSFVFLFYLSSKLNISSTYNMNLRKPIKNLWIIIPFMLLIIINLIDGFNFETIVDNPLLFITYFFAFLSTGFFEEILFRGVTFNLINNKFGVTKKGFYFSLFTSSFIFGFSHITHLLDGTMPLINFLNQMFYAFVIGILFTALYIRSNTLLIPILIHGLIDITGCTKYLSITSAENYIQSLTATAITYQDVLGNLVIFLPLLALGLFYLRKTNYISNEIIKD